jgi:hypothetical protein
MRTVIILLALALVASEYNAQWIQTNGPYGGTIFCFAVSGTNLFAGTGNGGVFLSTNNGTSWTAVNSGLTNPYVWSLAVSGTNLFAGTYEGGGVWRRPLSEMISAVYLSSSELPTEFSLEQNYPNPFNPVTNFQFSIVNRQLTILKVYNVLGQEVATLVNEVKQPGTYTVQWDASGMASGMYFYRIQAGDFVATRRLLLLK